MLRITLHHYIVDDQPFRLCVPLRLVQPRARYRRVGVIEVADRRFCERLAECRHAVLPPLFPDHRESLDVGEVLNGKLGVLPQGAGFPTVESALSNNTRNFPCCWTSRSNSGTKCW
jgi:hypothetical protein